MRMIWVCVLSLIALTIGTFGGLAWRGATSSIAGVRVACEVIATAERTNILTKAQINDTVDRLAKQIEKESPQGRDTASFATELKTGCPTFVNLGQAK
jgi:hypothetical protein